VVSEAVSSSYTHADHSRGISTVHSATVKNINLGIQKRNPIFRRTREIMRHFKAVYNRRATNNIILLGLSRFVFIPQFIELDGTGLASVC
jgi:metal-dependent hydrolase (beta-lactamase superfamily II)